MCMSAFRLVHLMTQPDHACARCTGGKLLYCTLPPGSQSANFTPLVHDPETLQLLPPGPNLWLAFQAGAGHERAGAQLCGCLVRGQAWGDSSPCATCRRQRCTSACAGHVGGGVGPSERRVLSAGAKAYGAGRLATGHHSVSNAAAADAPSGPCTWGPATALQLYVEGVPLSVCAPHAAHMERCLWLPCTNC